jgi:hypothetical protein
VNRKGDRAGPPRSNNAKTPDKEMKENAASLKDADSFKGIYANARFFFYIVVARYISCGTVPFLRTVKSTNFVTVHNFVITGQNFLEEPI